LSHSYWPALNRSKEGKSQCMCICSKARRSIQINQLDG
jgi:hypothetical protein